jgi:glycosidase
VNAGATCLLGLLLASPSLAADLRFASAVPAADKVPGDWLVAVEGARPGATPVFFADGVAVSAAQVTAAGTGWRLAGLPPTLARLGVARPGARAPDAVVRVGALPVDRYPWADWTIYHVMIEMFRNGSPDNDGEIRGWRHPNYAGGDLQGVREEAGYLADLGATAVWLSPIFAARTSHGYDVTNYYLPADQVAVPGDAQASLALFDQTLATLHGKGVKVVLDIPLNHASKSYDRRNGDPKSLGPRATAARQEAEKVWESWGSGYRYWDFDHAPTRAFLRDAARFWLARGVDGLRLDYVRGVPHDFWAELRADVDASHPGTYLVGECWQDQGNADANAVDIASYFAPVGGKPQLPSLLDFPLQIELTDVFARGGAASLLEEWLQHTTALYGADGLPTLFLDNHDMSRFLAWGGGEDSLILALTFMAAQSTPISLFYGSETGLADGAPKMGFTDTGRIPMPWGKLDQALIARVRDVLQARKAHSALGRGGRLPLVADRDVEVFAKVVATETALVGINLGATAREVVLDLGAVPAQGLAPVVGPASAPTRAADGRLRWLLPPKSASIAAAAVAPAE